VGVPHVEKLQQRVGDLLGDDETVRGAFVIHSGAAPGVEAFAGLLVPLDIILAIAGFLGLNRTRRWYSVAMTDQGIHLIRNRSERPLSVEHTWTTPDVLGPVEGRGDHKVSIDGTSYWVPLRWLDEARRVTRLWASRPPA
jgi:hypothetical protein